MWAPTQVADVLCRSTVLAPTYTGHRNGGNGTQTAREWSKSIVVRCSSEAAGASVRGGSADGPEGYSNHACTTHDRRSPAWTFGAAGGSVSPHRSRTSSNDPSPVRTLRSSPLRPPHTQVHGKHTHKPHADMHEHAHAPTHTRNRGVNVQSPFHAGSSTLQPARTWEVCSGQSNSTNRIALIGKAASHAP